MPVDPQVQALLVDAASLPPVHTLSVEDARAMFKAHPLPGTRAAEVASVGERTIPGQQEPLPRTPTGKVFSSRARRLVQSAR